MTLDMKELARLGAKARLAELDAERTAILKQFPGLRATKPEAKTATEPKKTRKRRKKMTAEQRKAASARMKAYWAKKKQ